MRKSTLESIIEKYYLNGLVEAVKLVIKDKSVVISFSPAGDKSLIGKITCANFDVDDASIGIYNTSQLIKLVKLLDHDIEFKINQSKTIADKLLLSDNQYDLEYCLAELNLIKSSPKVKEPAYDIEIDMSTDGFIKKFTDAKKALGDINQFTVTVENKLMTFIVGEGRSYTNKVKFSVPISVDIKLPSIPFSANMFNEVLLANKKSNSGTLKLSKEGLIKTTFQDGDLASEYFLIRLEDI